MCILARSYRKAQLMQSRTGLLGHKVHFIYLEGILLQPSSRTKKTLRTLAS